MSADLVAPRYEPARAFHQPKPAAFEFGVETVSMEELCETPATREVLRKHAPWAIHMAEGEMFKPVRSTFTLRDAAFFFPGDHSQSLADVDAALRQLPRSEWPRNVQ